MNPAHPRTRPYCAPLLAVALLATACTAGPAGRPKAVSTPAPARGEVSAALRPDAAFREAAARLDAEMRRWLGAEGPQRRDGFLYGLDVGPLLLYAAQRGDQALYQQLLPFAQQLVMNEASDPYTRGFVLWRRRNGQPPEVSGSAEALWLARALWAGAAAFGREQDRALALSVMDGYARHAFELQGYWLVRKYFAFEGRSFASLSSLLSYHPDFLALLEREAPRDAWRGFAERSTAMLERARTAHGLLKTVIQPEIAATYPDLDVLAYAPDGISALLDSCLGAEGALYGRPALAAALLDFARDGDHTVRTGRLYAYFRIRDGAPVGIAELSSAGYACLGRLAAGLDDRGAFEDFTPWLLLAMRDITRVPSAQVAPLYDGGQLLLAAYAAGAFSPER